MVLSQHKGKFFCITLEEELVLDIKLSEKIISEYLCKDPSDSVCIKEKNDLEEQRLQLKELRATKKANQAIEDQQIATRQKQQTCQTLGFEIGTESNGECVLKLMQMEIDLNKIEEEKTVYVQSGDSNKTAEALAKQAFGFL